MSRVTHIYDPVERFVAGTVGQPGERTFFLQARTGSRITSVSLEKAQVAALAQRVDMLIRDLRRTNPSIALIPTNRDEAPLEQPIFEEFRVGVISLSWDETKNLICIECEAVGDESEQVDAEGDLLKVYLTPGAASAFATRSLMVVDAGRTQCPFCEIPIDPQGHLCPRANGYRR
jgi:uncharacterized repeat protein (TIGR03847 family)